MVPARGESRNTRSFQRADWLDSRLFQAIGWSLVCLHISVQILASFSAPPSRYDDVVPLVASDLVLHGRVPAVDFWTNYPPLYYYLIAAGFRFFGRTILVLRLFTAALYVAVAMAAVHFLRRTFSHLRPLVPWMLFCVAVSIGTFTYPPWPGSGLALLALLVYLMSAHSHAPDRRWTALAGCLAGASSLIRFNFGAYVLSVAAADILVYEILTPTDHRLADRQIMLRLRRSFAHISAFVIPFALVNIVFYVWVYGGGAMAAPLRIIAYALKATSSRTFYHLQPEPDTLFWLAFPCAWICVREILKTDEFSTPAAIAGGAAAALTALALLAGGWSSVATWFPAVGFITVIALHRFVGPLPRAVLCLLLYCVCLQHYFLTRAGPEHAAPSYPVVALSLAFLAASPPGPKGETPAHAHKGLIFLILFAAAFVMIDSGLAPKRTLAKNTLSMLRHGGFDSRVPDRERLLSSDPSLLDEIRATELVRQRTAPSEPIFVGVLDHSVGFVTHARAYWLAERLPGMKYVQLDASVGIDESVQREIITDLERNGVNWAILYDASGTPDVGLYQNLAPGSKALDNFFATRFQEQARFGRFSVVRRK